MCYIKTIGMTLIIAAAGSIIAGCESAEEVAIRKRLTL